MFENLGHFFKKIVKTEQQKELGSKDAAKERLHLVLMQDRANVSADFLELMKQEIIDVIKKYIVVDEETIDVRLTNQPNEEGVTVAPSLYANIPIVNIKNDMMAEKVKEFKGIDFNKDMGLPTLENTEEEKKTETIGVIELLENYSEQGKQTTNEEIIEETNEELKEEIQEENEEEKEMFEEVDDDDDVTFDDLLKAAEEAEQTEQTEQASENINNEAIEANDNKNNKTKDKQKKNN